MSTTPTQDPAARPPDAVARRERARRIAGVVAIVVAVVFVAANTQEVTIHWVVRTTRTPLIVALVVSALLGAVVGYVVARRRAR